MVLQKLIFNSYITQVALMQKILLWLKQTIFTFHMSIYSIACKIIIVRLNYLCTVKHQQNTYMFLYEASYLKFYFIIIYHFPFLFYTTCFYSHHVCLYFWIMEPIYNSYFNTFVCWLSIVYTWWVLLLIIEFSLLLLLMLNFCFDVRHLWSSHFGVLDFAVFL